MKGYKKAVLIGFVLGLLLCFSVISSAATLKINSFICFTEESAKIADLAVKSNNYRLFKSLDDCIIADAGLDYDVIDVGITFSIIRIYAQDKAASMFILTSSL